MVTDTQLKIESLDFVNFRVESLIDNSITDFDVFLRLENEVVLYGAAGYRWFRQEIMDLLRSGYETLFVRRDDEIKIKTYLQLARLPQIQKDLPPEKRVNAIDDIGTEFLKCVYDAPFIGSVLDKGKVLADEITECIREDPGSVKFLNHLMEHDLYTYRHSIRVALYAVATAVGLGASDHKQLKEIALGGIFHDIGKKDVSIEVLNKAGALSKSEWEILRAHPKNGWTNVKDTLLSHVPREIILHHHEKRNGSGYPDGLDKNSLLLEVQVATLADIFDALTSQRAYQKRRSHFEALSFIKTKLVGEEINVEAFKALVNVLAN
jgi:HD-GYP domain-containing protein (c-di-GMP phosphodiesterase class II)